ncbi:MAG: aldo/keto reductase [Sphingomonas sp.]
MRYYTLGNTGLRISRLALGTMTFGPCGGWGTDEQTSRAMFDAYVATGGNFFDTADAYSDGESERLLGRFVREAGMRDKAVIATKFTANRGPGDPNAGGNGRKHILDAVDASLARLGTGHIDLYILHGWDRLTPPEEVMRTLDDLVRAGKIRHVGLSNVPAWYAARAQALAELRGHEPPCSLQLEYSLAERNVEDEFVDLGTRHGMGIVAWSPLASGLLSGKYRPGPDGAIAGDGRFAGMADGTPTGKRFDARNRAILAALAAAAAELGRTTAQVALNWVANRPGVASVLVGATTVAQLEDNLGALDFAIPPELAARLDAASDREPRFPYLLFRPGVRPLHAGGLAIGDKPPGYFRRGGE